jgi:hypothetical protein
MLRAFFIGGGRERRGLEDIGQRDKEGERLRKEDDYYPLAKKYPRLDEINFSFFPLGVKQSQLSRSPFVRIL